MARINTNVNIHVYEEDVAEAEMIAMDSNIDYIGFDYRVGLFFKDNALERLHALIGQYLEDKSRKAATQHKEVEPCCSRSSGCTN